MLEEICAMEQMLEENMWDGTNVRGNMWDGTNVRGKYVGFPSSVFPFILFSFLDFCTEN
jgi:hypothetical protein